MRVAYLDTSYLVAVVLKEPGWQRLRTALRPYTAILSSDLLAAELLAVLRREELPTEAARGWLGGIQWLYPDRSLRPEMERVLAHGYVRGADLWHLACACFVAAETRELPFLSRDARQRDVAAALGFPIP